MASLVRSVYDGVMGCAARVILGAALVGTLAACGRAVTVAPSASAPAPAPASAPPASAMAPASARPEASAAAPPRAASDDEGDGDGDGDARTSCLMLNVCSCNEGCARIDVPRPKLREGARGRIVAGPMKGEKIKVVTMVDSAGHDVLAVTDLLHDHACALAVRGPLLAYGCNANDSGPVPANACADGCP